MRVSTLRDDPGYVDDDRRWVVTLDDVMVERCVTADDEEGFVLIKRAPFAHGPALLRREGRVTISCLTK